jgi:hypothetical protein
MALRRAIMGGLRNVKAEDFVAKLGPGGALEGGFLIPNYTRAPFWKYFWVQNFVTRQHVFSLHHVGFLGIAGFCWWVGWFQTAPVQRRDKYYMNSAKFRIQSAYANPGTRPAFKIAQEQAKLRYIYRGLDHPFSLNEFKDYLFKMRENYLIQKYPGVQYPYVFKQMMPETTPDPLIVHPYPKIPDQPHHH